MSVKVYDFGIRSDEVAEHFDCTAAQADRALEFAFECGQQEFWESIEITAQDIFGPDVRVYSEGRSGGWLVLEGLPPVEGWDATMVARYARFCRECEQDIRWRTSRERLLDAIDINQWTKPGAERFNFVETAQGPACIADLKQQAIAAGFAPVVRGPHA